MTTACVAAPAARTARCNPSSRLPSAGARSMRSGPRVAAIRSSPRRTPDARCTCAPSGSTCAIRRRCCARPWAPRHDTMDDCDDLIVELRSIEERLRERAYERLRAAAEGDEDGTADEKRLSQARRAVERALRALGGEPEF